MKNTIMGWLPALLATTLHLAWLQLGGSVSLRRSAPPKKNQIGLLRAALTSRTEELHNQQNIAHGLQLEVRELQSEVQAEKQALARETAKEQALQLKLNRVQAVLSDSSDGNTVPKAAPAVASSTAPSSQREGAAQERLPTASPEVDPVAKASLQSPVALPVQTLEESVRDVQTQNESLDVVADTEQAEDAAPEDTATQQATQQEQSSAPKVAPTPAPTLPPAPTPKLSQELHPAATEATTLPQGAKPSAPMRRARPVKPVAKHVAAPRPSAPQPAPQLRASASSPTPPRPAAVASDSSSSGSKGAEASADFDALEAQLHEEDRRIQDLDRENALDAMTDSGGAPSAVSSSNHTSAKAMSAQPKLELDSVSEAPMEDFLNVEVPGPEPTSEAAASTPPEALALPQVAESVSVGLDGALSDEKFLSQMATTARH